AVLSPGRDTGAREFTLAQRRLIRRLVEHSEFVIGRAGIEDLDAVVERTGRPAVGQEKETEIRIDGREVEGGELAPRRRVDCGDRQIRIVSGKQGTRRVPCCLRPRERGIYRQRTRFPSPAAQAAGSG